MNPLLLCALFVVAIVQRSHGFDDLETAIVWNHDGRQLSVPLLLDETQKSLVILLQDFNLATLSRLMDAYRPDNDGGELRHFKKLLQQSRDTTILNDVPQSLTWNQLNQPFVLQMDVHRALDVAKWKDHAQSVVVSVDNWRDLDNLASKILDSGIMQGRTGVLASPPRSRQKRAIAQQPPSASFVNVSNGQCLLYASRIALVVEKYTNNKLVLDEYDLPADKLTGSGRCANYAGNLDLVWTAFPVASGQMQAVRIGLSFDHFARRWFLANVTLSAEGGLIEGGKVEHFFENRQVQRMQVAGAQEFCYACSRPARLMMPLDNGTPTKTRYGIAFRDLQLQPFLPSGRRLSPGFTTAVDDCAEFFSIPIWMGLISMGILLAITLFGVGMIASLHTMDRFDDPRGKPLVINAKD